MNTLMEATEYVAVGECASPACTAVAGHGNTYLFCPDHAAELAKIRDLYNGDTARFNPRLATARWYQEATCANADCFAPVSRPARFCGGCLDAEYVAEGEAA